MNPVIASELSKQAMKINRDNFTGSEKIRNSMKIVEINNYPRLLKSAIVKLTQSEAL